jgi:hypothetical protein
MPFIIEEKKQKHQTETVNSKQQNNEQQAVSRSVLHRISVS